MTIEVLVMGKESVLDTSARSFSLPATSLNPISLSKAMMETESSSMRYLSKGTAQGNSEERRSRGDSGTVVKSPQNLKAFLLLTIFPVDHLTKIYLPDKEYLVNTGNHSKGDRLDTYPFNMLAKKMLALLNKNPGHWWGSNNNSKIIQ